MKEVVSLTDDEQARASAIVDALHARGVKLILQRVPGRKYLKVSFSVPEGVRLPTDVPQIVEANSDLLYKYLMWHGLGRF
jgi:hypothetical protein